MAPNGPKAPWQSSPEQRPSSQVRPKSVPTISGRRIVLGRVVPVEPSREKSIPRHKQVAPLHETPEISAKRQAFIALKDRLQGANTRIQEIEGELEHGSPTDGMAKTLRKELGRLHDEVWDLDSDLQAVEEELEQRCPRAYTAAQQQLARAMDRADRREVLRTLKTALGREALTMQDLQQLGLDLDRPEPLLKLLPLDEHPQLQKELLACKAKKEGLDALKAEVQARRARMTQIENELNGAPLPASQRKALYKEFKELSRLEAQLQAQVGQADKPSRTSRN